MTMETEKNILMKKVIEKSYDKIIDEVIAQNGINKDISWKISIEIDLDKLIITFEEVEE